MDVRYHVDLDTGLPHIFGHGISKEEVEQVLQGLGDDVPARRDSRMKAGRKLLQAIHVFDDQPVGSDALTTSDIQHAIDAARSH